MNYKLIKDPVHGYIRVPQDYMKKIVDTCEFQRLRNIRQTSYDSLYPGSSHNRFIHSLGVYYLGCKAFEALKRNTEVLLQIKADDWQGLKNTFELACLLHDVGHMPFSHDGEDFLLISEEDDEFNIMQAAIGKSQKPPIKTLYNDLLRVMRKVLPKDRQDDLFDRFVQDFASTVTGSKNFRDGLFTAKPHEIMSVIVALKTYREFLQDNNVEMDLFARAILGLQYTDHSKVSSAVRNALIQLLNSSIIDVDRLDYIIRDSQMSGLDSVTIDVERLLESVTIIFLPQDDIYQFAYKKNASSIIENVVLAYDAERRWIQAHPVVIYDSFLVKQCLSAIDRNFKIHNSSQGIFQQNALTSEGVLTEGGLRIRLLNDSDCIFLMKQLEISDENYYVKEYFSRNQRKQPIWKSEAEFSLILDQLLSDQKTAFLRLFGAIGEEKDAASIGRVLNRNRIKELEKDLGIKEGDKVLSDENRINSAKVLRKQLFWLKKLENYFEKDLGITFEMCNQISKEFQSKVNDLSNESIRIWFDSLQKSNQLSKLQLVYATNEEWKKTQQNERNPVLYWYIHKIEEFSLDKFVGFLQQIAREYEHEFK